MFKCQKFFPKDDCNDMIVALKCLASMRVVRGKKRERKKSTASLTTMKRLKHTPGETRLLRNEVRLVYFPNLILLPPMGPLLLKMFLFVKLVP